MAPLRMVDDRRHSCIIVALGLLLHTRSSNAFSTHGRSRTLKIHDGSFPSPLCFRPQRAPRRPVLVAAAREPEASDFGGSSGLADRLFVGSRKASALSSVVERWRRSFLKTATLFSFLMASLCILQHITPMCIIPASHARAVAATVQEADGMAQKVKFAKACLSFGLGIFVGSLVMKGKSFMRKDEGTRTSGSGDKDKDSEAVAIDITA